MTSSILKLSGADPQGGRLTRLIEDDRAWTRHTLDPGSATLEISEPALREIVDVAKAFSGDAQPITERTLDALACPELEHLIEQVMAKLDMAPGFVVINALPLDDFSEDISKALFWAIGSRIGPHVAQRWDGSMLYDVRDTGQTFGYGVRGSHTSVELVFHTDNVSGRALPDYVGLLCLQPAKEGGISRFCSLYTMHNRLLQTYPEVLPRLYQPLLFDRQAEHHPNEPKVLSAPMFEWDGKKLKCRANINLNRKGYAVAGLEPDAETEAALLAIEDISRDPDLWVEAPLQRGQIQFLNNRELAHYRSAFVDYDKSDQKRHLVRTWHRKQGSPDYQG